MLGAGDTFRAAATEQLEEWGRRAGAEMVRAPSDSTRPDTVLYQVWPCMAAAKTVALQPVYLEHVRGQASALLTGC